MLFIIALVLAFGFAFFCKKPLKKYPYLFYISALAVTVVVASFDFRDVPVFAKTYILGLFTRGAFATALWCVVMWTGTFKNGGKLMKIFMPIRGELSIFVAILTLGHNIGFGKTYFVRLFTDASKMPSNQLAASIMTIIMLVIMIPLTVISFPKIRKKIAPRTWKNIQRTAYIFYALIYLHVMTLFAPMAKMGRDGYFADIIIYSVVFIGYAVCRIKKWYVQTNNRAKKNVNMPAVNTLSSLAFIICMIAPAVYSMPSGKNIHAQGNAQNTGEQSSSSVTTQVSTAPAVTSVTENTVSSAVSTVTSLESATEFSVTSVPEETTQISEISETTEQNEITQQSENTEKQEEQTPPPPPPQEEEPPAPIEPEIQYLYNNGTYTASAYGYDGDVTVSVTIENDVIVSITGSTAESDDWYFNSAKDYVFPQLISSFGASADAYSGATYSSNAIMSAVAQALDMARK